MTTDQIDDLGMEQLQALFELYVRQSKQTGTAASLSDFCIWLQERD